MNCGYREGWLCSQALHSRAAVPNFVPQGLVSWKVGGVDGETVGGALELKGGGRQEVELRPASAHCLVPNRPPDWGWGGEVWGPLH